MTNEYIVERLKGIQNVLTSIYQSNSSMSSSTKGTEREFFINLFLSQVLPPTYRFGSGDVTDSIGNKSGQLDIVVEYPFFPSLPLAGASTSRLYLAEGVACVIEVKSSTGQWTQACQTASKLARLNRSLNGSQGRYPDGNKIPLIVAAYTGWKKLETVRKKLEEQTDISAILIIEHGLFVCKKPFSLSPDEDLFASYEGPLALWGVISFLHEITSSLQSASKALNNFA